MGLATGASAIPSLQLDIVGGVWDAATQTVIAQGDSFQVYAYLIPDGSATLSTASGPTSYYISAALMPRTTPPGGSLGSFSFDSTTVNVTADMYYGSPPLEAYLAYDPHDLSPHGIFETYFSEFSFTFDPANLANAYNVQDTTGAGPTTYSGTGASMYYQAFNVNVAGLADGYGIHFDLYNETIVSSRVCTGSGRTQTCTYTSTGDIDRNAFAPYSHDAQSGTRREVTEPSSLAVAGLGLLAVGFATRRLRHRS